MGVPAFYRWLVDRYPAIVVDVVEEGRHRRQVVDTSKPNPNSLEFDNMYLDMNGIIHPCFHPMNEDAPKTYAEVFERIFAYIDRLFAIVRPRKLLYMAVDGVAPRAKMNQQRARRFQAARDAASAVVEEERLRKEYEAQGCILPPKQCTEAVDSNVITPGTEFMESLAVALRYYIHLRLNNDPGWRNIKVILSDANSPGEGEHKIMSYIRLQRNLSGSDPNVRHCLYGLDADLIMLALATHEVHFSILREVVFIPMQHETCFICGKIGHSPMDCGSENAEIAQNEGSKKQPFQFVHVWKLREYIQYDMKAADFPFAIDAERLIDDFVFLCFFVGNDFVPHMPTLDIREGAINLLMCIYKKEFKNMGGYLTRGSMVDLNRVEHFIRAVGAYEDKIFQKRARLLQAAEKDARDRAGVEYTSEYDNIRFFTNDKIKLGEPGWKERYYKQKFGMASFEDCEALKKDVVRKYVEGLCWVMKYYYQGVSSWKWFYPYHYAPFASDLVDLGQLEISFSLGKPFKPFDQLMGVLPAASAIALPEKYRWLMRDPSSPIIDFYPLDFEIDMNGKRFAWQGVVKLPFIDEERLLAETQKLEESLTDAEAHRNTGRPDMLFLTCGHPLARLILSCSNPTKDLDNEGMIFAREKIDPISSGGMNGYFAVRDADIWPTCYESSIPGMQNISNNIVLSVIYVLPDAHMHVPQLADGVSIPEKTITEDDLKYQPMWHEDEGRKLLISERALSAGSISGNDLSGASHRLIEKVLKSESTAELPASQTVDKYPIQPSLPSAGASRRRPAGPLGYEKGFNHSGFNSEDTSSLLDIITCAMKDARNHPRKKSSHSQSSSYSTVAQLQLVTCDKRSYNIPSYLMGDAGFTECHHHNPQVPVQQFFQQPPLMTSPSPICNRFCWVAGRDASYIPRQILALRHSFYFFCYVWISRARRRG